MIPSIGALETEPIGQRRRQGRIRASNQVHGHLPHPVRGEAKDVPVFYSGYAFISLLTIWRQLGSEFPPSRAYPPLPGYLGNFSAHTDIHTINERGEEAAQVLSYHFSRYWASTAGLL